MARQERDPIQELLRYAIVAGGMVLIVLVLTRGKWLTGAVLGVWLLATVIRFKRAAKQDRP
ncbi:MAG TPA: hypothetical protein VLC92_18355 [Rhodocyclaceae bacterium]|nr:hypothetical protein [Rhodocyclaceae bacterium]